MSDAYLILTENPLYNGKTFGLQFNRGRAVLSEATLDEFLGYTVESVLGLLRDFPGYSARPLSTKARKFLEEEEDGEEKVDEVGQGGPVSEVSAPAKRKSKKS